MPSSATVMHDMECNEKYLVIEMHGHAAIQRSKQDGWSDALIIPNPTMGLSINGTVTGWHVYCRSTVSLTYQIWRHQSLKSYTLVGQSVVKPPAKGYQPWTLPTSEQFPVKVGDVIGFAFKNGNSIPYDSYSTGCSNPTTLYLYVLKPTNYTVGENATFSTADPLWGACRKYSLNVRITRKTGKRVANIVQ